MHENIIYWLLNFTPSGRNDEEHAYRYEIKMVGKYEAHKFFFLGIRSLKYVRLESYQCEGWLNVCCPQLICFC